MLCYSYLSMFAFAESPSFSEQEIIDEVGQWIDLNSKTLSRTGDPSTYVISVDYSSNGTSLDAVLWLLFPFKENPQEKMSTMVCS